MLVVFNTDGIWLIGYGQEEVVYDLGDEWGYSREVGKGSKAQKDGLISLMMSSTSFCKELSGGQSTTVRGQHSSGREVCMGITPFL